MNRIGALLTACQAQTGDMQAVQSSKDGSGGVGEGNFTAWMFASLLVTCVQYYPGRHMQGNLSGCGLGEQTETFERADQRVANCTL